MSGHARPSLPDSEPVRPHRPLPHTIKDALKIALHNIDADLRSLLIIEELCRQLAG